MYPQHSSSQVAQRPLYAEIGEIASELTRAIDLTEKEAQLVQDIRKGRNRFVMLELLLDIASRHPAVAESLIGVFERRLRQKADGSPCVASAFNDETAAQGEADFAQRLFEQAPCRSTYRRVRDSLARHRFTLDRAIETVDRTMQLRSWQ